MKQSTKMRVKLYDPHSGELTQDRLVEQSTEVNLGPKEKHTGPISLEINLVDQESTTALIAYIQKLVGSMPITKKLPKQVRLKQGTIELNDAEPLEELVATAFKRYQTQEDLIKFLRDQGFKFIDSHVITDIVPELADKLKLRDKDKDFQFMIRLVKEAKDPKNDKYDYRLLFGIKILGDKQGKVLTYLFGKFNNFHKIAWKSAKKDVLFKKHDRVMEFPEHMDYDERKKWRTEYQKLQLTGQQGKPMPKPSKYFMKNARFVLVNKVPGDKAYENLLQPATHTKASE